MKSIQICILRRLVNELVGREIHFANISSLFAVNFFIHKVEILQGKA